jgi:cyclohexa-1,5-dienecarbonyl-CoA hydratase
MELAIACDVIIARDDATLGQPEVRLGVFPPAAAAMLPGLIGRARAMDLILSGRSVKAAEALAMGLVSSVLAGDAFSAGVEDYVARIASYSAPVLRLAKRAALEGMRLEENKALANAEELYLSDLMSLNDPQEGLAAWIDKRTPTWRNA